MKVTASYEVLLNLLRAAFPQVTKPPFGYSDLLGEYASTGFPRVAADSGIVYSGNDSVASDGLQGNMEFDTLAKGIHKRSIFVPHDQILTPGSPNADSYGYGDDCVGPNGLLQMSWWDLLANSESGFIQNITRRPGYEALQVGFAPASDFMMRGEACVACQGFTAILRMATPAVSGGFQSFTTLRWRVAGSNYGVYRWYALSWIAGDGVWFGYCDYSDDDGWPIDEDFTAVDRVKMGGNRTELLSSVWDTDNDANDDLSEFSETDEGNIPAFSVTVKFLGGIMQIQIEGEDTPFCWPHDVYGTDGIPDWLIDRWQIFGGNINMVEWSVHPTKWASDAGTISQDVNVGFVPDAGQISGMAMCIHALPNNTLLANNSQFTGFAPYTESCLVFPYDLNGTVFRYRVALSGPIAGTWNGWAYSDFTPLIGGVSFDFPGQVFSISNAPTILGSPGSPSLPETIDIEDDYDLERLTISSRCHMTFNNFQSVWTNWLGTGIVDAGGHMAAQINLGIVEFANGRRPEFTGVFNTDFVDEWPGGGRDRVTVHGQDCSIMLDVPVWNLPWFDGWNVYYVMAYLALLGGVSPTQLGFATYVPADRYGASPGLPALQQYFMPLGPAGTALTRFGGGQKIWDIMLKIAQSIGFTLFYDVLAVLQFYKFQLPTATSIKKVFSFVPDTNLSEIWNGSYRGGLRDTRNSVTVIGVNAFGPIWNPIVAHSTDDASVFLSYVGNYKGYYDPVVWVDNIFANQAFAQSAADAMLAFLRLPDRSVQFSTWYQGDQGIYPGDLIAVSYPRSGASLYPFFVVGTRIHISKTEAPRLEIIARLVPMV